MLKTVIQCLLLSLLAAVCLAGPAGTRSTPLHLSRGACQVLSRALLQNVTATLQIDHLFRGLNCTEQSPQLSASTKTLSVCMPQDLLCLNGTDFTFDQHECLQSVLEDLRYYWATFKSYHDSDQILKEFILKSIENLMQGCFTSMLLDEAQVHISVNNENSFERRLKLCKVLKGFHIRSVTINRVLNHIVSSL